jgi:hypothetical protein
MPETLLMQIPVVFDEDNREVVSVSILPGAAIIRSWLADPVISASVISEPLERSPKHPVMFLPKLKELLVDVSSGHLKRLRLLVFHAAWEAVAQTSGVQIGNDPFFVNRAGFEIPQLVYPIFSLFLGDTPEQNKVQAHRNGGLTEEICARCCATSRNNGFAGFVLRLDRKATVDELLKQIADKRDVREARDKLQMLSLHDVLPFTDRLRHFDASLCCPACSLHVGRLLWTKTLLELVGVIVGAAQGGEGPAKRLRGERDPDDLIGRLNDQYVRFFPRSKGLYDRNGKLDIGVKTGNHLTEIAEMLPFILFNILPKEFQFVQVAAVEWIKCLRLWLKPGKSVVELGELERVLGGIRNLFVDLHEKASRVAPFTRPTFHSLLHPPMDQILFGDDDVIATQALEKSHSSLVKQPFRFETNRSFDYTSVSKQVFNALFQRSFMVKLPDTEKPRKLVRRTGLVSPLRSTIGMIIAEFREWDGSIGVTVSHLSDQVERIAKFRGTWSALTAPFQTTPNNAELWFFNSMEACSASGYRLSSGIVVRTFFGGDAISKNCVVELAGDRFALVFLICGLSNSVIDNVPLLYCKKLDHALREGPVCPLHHVPLLRDSDMRVKQNQFVVDPGDILRVWTAVTVHTSPEEFQYLFAIPIDK